MEFKRRGSGVGVQGVGRDCVTHRARKSGLPGPLNSTVVPEGEFSAVTEGRSRYLRTSSRYLRTSSHYLRRTRSHYSLSMPRRHCRRSFFSFPEVDRVADGGPGLQYFKISLFETNALPVLRQACFKFNNIHPIIIMRILTRVEEFVLLSVWLRTLWHGRSPTSQLIVGLRTMPTILRSGRRCSFSPQP